MKLKDFIERLEKIEEDHGGDLEVVMSDNIPVVVPVLSDKYHGKNVVITDQDVSIQKEGHYI